MRVFKALALGLAVVLAMSSLAAGTPPRAEHRVVLQLDPGAKDLQVAMAEHHCTTTGFGTSASPRSALVRRHGVLRHVTFERAWSVFTGESPGELVAVCLSEVSVAERPVTSRA